MAKMEIKGLSDFQKSLNDYQKKVEKVTAQSQVSFDELFIPSFMKKYTNFESLDELFKKGNFIVNNQEDYEKIPEKILDKHVASNSIFSTWQEMLKKAGEEYLERALSF